MSENLVLLRSWLEYVTESVKTETLTGGFEEYLISHAAACDLAMGYVEYFAEFPLKGKSGLDLSVQYTAKDFTNGNKLVNLELEAYNILFTKYAASLAKNNQHILPLAGIYLETDSFSGTKGNPSVFVNLAGNFVEPELLKLLELQGLQRFQEPLEMLLMQGEGVVNPWQFGFMYSRKPFSIRVVLSLVNKKTREILNLLERIGFKNIPYEDLQAISQIIEAKDIGILLDFDIMEDGSVGTVLGLEISPVTDHFDKQQVWFSDDSYKKLELYLVDNDLADSRMSLLPQLVFAKDIRNTKNNFLAMVSILSHIKLQWQLGQRKIPKAYFEIYSCI